MLDPRTPASPVARLPRLARREFSPPVELDRISTDRGHVWVAREDKLAGGTKQRAIVPFLQRKIAEGHREFVYASPFAGFAQVALAVACKTLGVRCTIYSERVPAPSGDAAELHAFSRLAATRGARVELCDDLASASVWARTHARLGTDCLEIPLGFDCAEYRQGFVVEMLRLWPPLCTAMRGAPRRVWVALGSGTLSTILRLSIEPSIELCCLDVGVLSPDDPRVQAVRALANTTVYRVRERFADVAEVPPPIPSNAHYDAKLWRWVRARADANDLWWNVAR